MATIIEITDLAAPELAVYSHLTEHQLRSRLEPEKGICIVETPKVIGTALENGLQPVSFLMERKRITGLGKPFVDTCDVPVYTGDRERLAALTGYTLTRGVLCAMKRPVLPAAETILQDARLVCVLSGVVDSTNIGAIFRSAAALGVDAVLVMDDCCDPLCRRAIRVSMGTVFQIPWTWISSLDVVRKGGFRTTDRSGLMIPCCKRRKSWPSSLAAKGMACLMRRYRPAITSSRFLCITVSIP